MNDMPTPAHVPVMLEETVQALAVQPGGRYIDCTVGAAGHAVAILEHAMPGGQLLGIDADPFAIELAMRRLEPYEGSFLLINGDFSHLEDVCVKYDFMPVHGVLFDLGLSSMQIESAGRGFSFNKEGPLDMRFSPRQKQTAADIVNNYPREQLADILRNYGEERFSHRVADAIVRARPLRTTTELAAVVERALGGRSGKIHPATRTFQALRIAVNEELERLESALRQSLRVLGSGGRLVVISYHSLEDRIVKRFMQTEARDCICPPEVPACVCGHRAQLRIINRKVVTPTPEEIERNPRSRSARLRAAERLLNRNEYARGVDTGLCMHTRTNGWRKPATLRKLRAVFSAAA